MADHGKARPGVPRYDTSAAAWLRRFDRCSRPAARVLLLPHAGGSAQYFWPLAELLATEAEVIVVQYPHRLERRAEPPVQTVEEFAELIAGLVRDDSGLPLIAFGHSMGALIAYEVCLLLEQDRTVHRLVVSACLDPLGIAAGRFPSTDGEILAAMRSIGGTDPSVWDHPDLIDAALPALRADYAALGRYERLMPSPISCPILSLAGADDGFATPEQSRGWADFTWGIFQQRVLPGDHFFVADHLETVRDLLLESHPPRGTGRGSE